MKKIKNFQCDVCEYKTVYSQNLKLHKSSMHATGSYQCSQCDFFGKTKHCVSIHQKTHAANNFECLNCEAKLGSHQLLREHYGKVHRECRFKCNFLNCNYVAKANRSLTVHQMYHTKPFECDFCGRRFGRKSSCAEHILLHHTNSDCFKCHVCDKRLCNRTVLRNHLQNHEENVPKPFECQQCAMKFRSKQILKNHQQIIHESNNKI